MVLKPTARAQVFAPPHIYRYIYMGWVQVTPGITLSNVTSPNNLLLSLYFENLNVGLYVLYVLNMHANFHVNQMLFIIQSINSSFMHYFKLQKLKFK